jgi:hypothetical protein
MSGTYFAYAILDKSRMAGASVDVARLSEAGSVIGNPNATAKQKAAQEARPGDKHITCP